MAKTWSWAAAIVLVLSACAIAGNAETQQPGSPKPDIAPPLRISSGEYRVKR